MSNATQIALEKIIIARELLVEKFHQADASTKPQLKKKIDDLLDLQDEIVFKEINDYTAELNRLAGLLSDAIAVIKNGAVQLDVRALQALVAQIDPDRAAETDTEPGSGSTTRPTPPADADGDSAPPAEPPAEELDRPDPVPETDGQKSFIAARVPAPKTVVYVANDGSEVVREGGSRAWRNNNPGNIQKGSFANANGAIGGDARFAIFPDESVGLEAIVTLLRGPSYRNRTLKDAINRYAPPHENNTAGYVSFVSEKTGVGAEEVLKDLTAAKIRAISRSIKQIEGWIPGTERRVGHPGGEAGSPAEPLVSAASAAEEWMSVAKSEASLPAKERSEWSDPGENPRILNYFKIAAPWFNPAAGDEVDWCAAFVNFCLETSGYSGTGHPGARSFFWNKNNNFLKLNEPAYGCVAVFRKRPFTDPKWKSGAGHVGFVVDWNADTVTLLGGNQGNTVQRKVYRRVLKDANGRITRKIAAFVMPAKN